MNRQHEQETHGLGKTSRYIVPRPVDPAFHPRVLSDLWALSGTRLSPYLMALAAAQRGLKVVFWGSSVQARVHLNGQRNSPDRPRLFTVEDASDRHLFDSTLGDKISPDVQRLCKDKIATKEALCRSGLAVPNGILFDEKDKAQLRSFLDQSESGYFIAKPVDGSRGQGIIARVTRDQLLKSTQGKDTPRYLIEEQIMGREYRVYVVDGRVAAAYLRPGAFVVGNGRDTIGNLIGSKNEQRSASLHFSNRLIDPFRVSAFLAGSGKSLNNVPLLGERVLLSHSHSKVEGGSVVEATLDISRDVAETAIRVCSALGLVHGGIDLIESEDRVYVLEANTRAIIDTHSFPETGNGSANIVAEAIIDSYFPPSADSRRNAEIQIDFHAIRAAFDPGSETTRHEVRVVGP